MATIEEIAERNALGNVLSELEYQNEQLRQRVAELEGGLNAVLEAVKLPGKKGEFQQENGLVFVTRLVKQRNAVIEIAHKALGIPME